MMPLKSPPHAVATAFVLLALAYTATIVSGCGPEQPTSDDGRIPTFPVDAVQIGDRYVADASFSGSIAEAEAFSGVPYIQVDDRSDSTTIELALEAEGVGAVMHLLTFEGGLASDRFAVGTALHGERDADGIAAFAPVLPVACTGPVMDRWEEDVRVKRVDLEIEGDGDDVVVQWRLVTVRYATPEHEQASWGTVVLAPLDDLDDERNTVAELP